MASKQQQQQQRYIHSFDKNELREWADIQTHTLEKSGFVHQEQKIVW